MPSILRSHQKSLGILALIIPIFFATCLYQAASSGWDWSKVTFWSSAKLSGMTRYTGLYAIIAFTVQRRSREIGIRMAIGASSAQVVWVVVRDAATYIGIGTAVGLGLSVLATLALRAAYAPAPGLSFFRPSVDPIALAALALIMALVGLTAALLPARRVVRIDPLIALRAD